VVDQVTHVQYLDATDIRAGGVNQHIEGICSHGVELIQILNIDSIMNAYLPRAEVVEGE